MEGKGSTFKLTFIAEPAQTGSGASAAASGLKASNRRAKHILVVDDNALNRRVAKLFLKPGGYCVTEAENGLEALKRLAEDSFDIVLLDIHMPVLDGLATLKRMRASSEPWNTIPVIALTADAISGDRERYLAEGMDGYISKPIDQRELLAEIARLLRAPLSQVGG
jgi:CheY-like chemotaxis protein